MNDRPGGLGLGLEGLGACCHRPSSLALLQSSPGGQLPMHARPLCLAYAAEHHLGRIVLGQLIARDIT